MAKTSKRRAVVALEKGEAKTSRRAALAIRLDALDNDLEALNITKQIVDSLKQGASKTFESDPLDKWVGKLFDAVKASLAGSNKWVDAEKNVTEVAKAMGQIAKTLSHQDSKIDEARLRAAFNAAKLHRRCSSAKIAIAGIWCDFDF